MSIPPEIIDLIAEEAFRSGLRPQNLLAVSSSFSHLARKRLYRSISLNLNEVPWRDHRPKALIEILEDNALILQYIRSITILSDSDELMYDKSQEHSRSQVGPPIETGVSLNGPSFLPLLNALSGAPIIELVVDSIPHSILPFPALVRLRSQPTLRRFVFIGRGPLPPNLAIGNTETDSIKDLTLIIHPEFLYAHDSDSDPDAADESPDSSSSKPNQPGTEPPHNWKHPPPPVPFQQLQRMRLGQSSDLFDAVGAAYYRVRDGKEQTTTGSTPISFPSPPQLTFDLIALKSLAIRAWMKYSTSGYDFLAIREILHHVPALEELEIESDFDHSLNRDFVSLPPQQSPYRAIATLPRLRSLNLVALDQHQPLGALTGISEGLQEITRIGPPPNLEKMSVCLHWWAKTMASVAEKLDAVPEQERSLVRDSLERCDCLKKLVFCIQLFKPDETNYGDNSQDDIPLEHGEELLKDAMEKYRGTLSCDGRIEVEYKITK